MNYHSFLKTIDFLNYNKKMQSSYATSKIIKRTSHIQSIKDSLKQIPLLKRHSYYQQLQSQATNFQNQNQQSLSTGKQATTYSLNSDINLSKSISSTSQNSFFDKYELLEMLGSGCNACVYKCQKKRNQKMYAVKKIKIDRQHVLELKQIFITLKNLKNTSICLSKEIFFDNNERFCFLVMQYFPHPDLSSIKIRSEEELKIIVQNLVFALSYLHSHNICHRDIKPQNILYDQKNKKIKIVDFGISKKTFLRGSRRDMLTIIGTNFFFAPQIYLGGGYDERVDIWALGVTIYKLITGYTPFQCEYHADTIANILKGQVQYDESIWSNYSSFAKDFVSRLLKQKNQRMSLNQCQKHLWFHSQNPTNKKFRRMSSDYILLNEEFRQQMRNYHEANPKEDSHKYKIENMKTIFKNIETFGDSDSDESQY